MSLLPILLNELAAPRDQHLHRYHLNDLFTPRLSPHDLLLLQGAPLRAHCPALRNRNVLKNDGNEFRVNLDVQQFKPEEISVKVVDNSIIVEGQHEEREDEHGYVQRQFQRRYLIPKDVDPEGIQSNLSSDGVLTVSAPKKSLKQGGERNITIVHTNKPAISHSDDTPPATQEADGDKK